MKLFNIGSIVNINNTRLSCKGLPETNTLAYLSRSIDDDIFEIWDKS